MSGTSNLSLSLILFLKIFYTINRYAYKMIQIKTKKKVVTKEEVEEVVCDMCGSSCAKEVFQYKGKTEKRYEYMTLEAYWGYYSSKDFEYWCAQICETCVDTRLSALIKFTKGEYNLHGVKKKSLKRMD